MTKWHYFRDLVSELVINNPSLKDSTKFFHLHNCLAPNLQQAIANILNQPTTFQSPGSFLPPVNAHVEQIFNPPHYTPGSASSLRSLVDHIKANLSSLRILSLSVSIEDLLV